jgi:putative membrane protein
VDIKNIFPTMTENADNVSRIHKRYTLTTLTPSSHYLSLLISFLVASATVALALFAYFKTGDKIFFSLPLSVAVLYGTQLLDSRLLKTEFSKVVHLHLETFCGL